MYRNAVFLSLALCVSTAWAASTKYLTADDAIMAQVKQWQRVGEAKPILSDDGTVLYPFGQYMPTLVCSTLRVCDIQLEPGEKTVGLPSIGDPRIKVSSAYTGAADNRTTHAIIKATVEGITTNLIIPTDRRIYDIRIRSSKEEGGAYMNRIGFYYPEDIAKTWTADIEAQQTAAAKKDRLVQANLGKVSLDKIYMDYKIEGDADFKPTRIMSADGKTYIYLPSTVRSSQMPILVVYDEKGNLVKVNYNSKPYGCKDEDCSNSVGDMLVVDFNIKHGALVLGTDDSMAKVEFWSKKDSGFSIW